MRSGDIYRNKKSGDLYVVLCPNAIECTNARDGGAAVWYAQYPSFSGRYQRDIEEFLQKFDATGERYEVPVV